MVMHRIRSQSLSPSLTKTQISVGPGKSGSHAYVVSNAVASPKVPLPAGADSLLVRAKGSGRVRTGRRVRGEVTGLRIAVLAAAIVYIVGTRLDVHHEGIRTRIPAKPKDLRAVVAVHELKRTVDARIAAWRIDAEVALEDDVGFVRRNGLPSS